MTTIFGNPGSTELPMFRDFPDDFHYVLGLQEAVVVGMADGFAQASGKAAFVNLHSAAGVGNAMGAIFTASRNRSPLVIVAGQQARELLPFDPFLGSARAAELPLPHVKWSCEPARAEDVGRAVQRAWLIATQPPYGPTLVSVPSDDWERMAAPLPRRERLGEPETPAESAIAMIGDALDRAVSPTLIAGAELDSEAGWQLTKELAERYGAAVWSPPMSHRCAFPQDHPLFAGHLAARPEAMQAQLEKHDLVLVLGAPAFTYHVPGSPPWVAPGTRLFHVSNDNEYAAAAVEGMFVPGNCCGALRALLARQLPNCPKTPQTNKYRPEGESSGLTAATVLAELDRLRNVDSILVEEAPSNRPDIQACMQIRRAKGYYAMASGGLGFGLSAAVGIALASPDKQVIAIIGDGSAMYALPALWSAAQEGVPLKVLILNNGGYAALDGFARQFKMEPVGTKLPHLDFVKLAEGQGIVANRVDQEGDLAGAMRSWLAARGAALLEVKVQTQ